MLLSHFLHFSSKSVRCILAASIATLCASSAFAFDPATIHHRHVVSTDNFSAFLRDDGEILVAGATPANLLSTGGSSIPVSLVKPAGVTSFLSVAVQYIQISSWIWGGGEFQRLAAVGNDNKVYTWGRGGTAVMLPFSDGAVSVWAGASAIYAIRSDGSVIYWTHIDRIPKLLAGVSGAVQFDFLHFANHSKSPDAFVLTDAGAVYRLTSTATEFDETITATLITGLAPAKEIGLAGLGGMAVLANGSVVELSAPSVGLPNLPSGIKGFQVGGSNGKLKCYFISAEGGAFEMQYNNSGWSGAIPVANLPENVAFTELSINGGAYFGVGEYQLWMDDAGLVYGTGSNQYGQFANGMRQAISRPVQVPGLKNIVDISPAFSAGIAKDSSNRAYVWGDPSWFSSIGLPYIKKAPTLLTQQLTGDPINAVGAIAAGWNQVVLSALDGNIAYHYGYKNATSTVSPIKSSVVMPGGNKAIKALAVSDYGNGACYAIIGDAGNVVSWGWNDGGLGRGVTADYSFTPNYVKTSSGAAALSGATKIVADYYKVTILLSSGALRGVGNRDKLFGASAGTMNTWAGSPTLPVSGGLYTDIFPSPSGAIGYNYITDAVSAWGDNEARQYGDGAAAPQSYYQRLEADVKGFALSNYATVQLNENGAVKSWGNVFSNVERQYREWNGIIGSPLLSRATPAPAEHIMEVVNSWQPASKFTKIVCQDDVAFGIRESDGTVWMWGRRDYTGSGVPAEYPSMAALRLIASPLDLDRDGLPDAFEAGLPGGDSAPGQDTDLDGLPDTTEWLIGSNPANADTDGDGFQDGGEQHVRPTVTAKFVTQSGQGGVVLKNLSEGLTVKEGDTVSVKFTSSKPFGQATDIFYTLTHVTTDGSDIVTPVGKVTFPAGSSEQTALITIKRDFVFDDNEQFTFSVAETQSYLLDMPADSGMVMVRDSLPFDPADTVRHYDASYASLNEQGLLKNWSGASTIADYNQIIPNAVNGRPAVKFNGPAGFAETTSYAGWSFFNLNFPIGQSPSCTYFAICRGGGEHLIAELKEPSSNTVISSLKISRSPAEYSAAHPGTHKSRLSYPSSDIGVHHAYLPGRTVGTAFQNYNLIRRADGSALTYLNGAPGETIPEKAGKAGGSTEVTLSIGGSGLELAELVILNRAVTEPERVAMNSYLTAKYGELNAAPAVAAADQTIGGLRTFPFDVTLEPSLDDGHPVNGSLSHTVTVTPMVGSNQAVAFDHDNNPATLPKIRFSGYGIVNVNVKSSDGAVESEVGTARISVRPFEGKPKIWVSIDNSDSMSSVVASLRQTKNLMKVTLKELLYDSGDNMDDYLLFVENDDERWLRYVSGVSGGFAKPAVNAPVVSLVYTDENNDGNGGYYSYHSGSTYDAAGLPFSQFVTDLADQQPGGEGIKDRIENPYFIKGIIYAIGENSTDNLRVKFQEHLNAAINHLPPYTGIYAPSSKLSCVLGVPDNRPAAAYVNDVLAALGLGSIPVPQ